MGQNQQKPLLCVVLRKELGGEAKKEHHKPSRHTFKTVSGEYITTTNGIMSTSFQDQDPSVLSLIQGSFRVRCEEAAERLELSWCLLESREPAGILSFSPHLFWDAYAVYWSRWQITFWIELMGNKQVLPTSLIFVEKACDSDKTGYTVYISI